MPMSDDQWSVRVEPAILLPGRPVSVTVAYIPTRDHPVRGVTIALRCVELYRYDRSETVSGGQGVTHVRTVTHTAEGAGTARNRRCWPNPVHRRTDGDLACHIRRARPRACHLRG